ncbi:MAG: prephenate dehydrogenase [Clostridia bacterium]
MNIGIIGLGLIGGSFAKAIKKCTNFKVLGYDISDDVMRKANLIEAIDDELTLDNIGQMDMVIIALNPQAVCDTLDKIVAKLKNGAIIFDIAGNKTLVVGKMRKLQKQYENINFLSTHPMAGKEFSGLEHATANLFCNAMFVLIPICQNLTVLTLVKNFMLELGFLKVIISTEKEHDKIIAYTSQLPHIISSCYVKSATAPNHFGFSAGSFKDLTRVAKLNPTMWEELFLQNKDNLLAEIEALQNRLQEYKEAINRNNAQKLTALLQDGNDKKEMIDKATRVLLRSDNENN